MNAYFDFIGGFNPELQGLKTGIAQIENSKNPLTTTTLTLIKP